MASHNGDLEHLVEQITDVIVARLNGEMEEQAALCGCASECFNRCPERMHRIVDAGAERIGLALGQTATAGDWASLIDHTLLKPEATEDDIKRIINLAEQLHSESGTLLIHCEAGISRSTATALIMYACWLGRGREDEAMQRVIAQRPFSSPNRRMVALADKLLALDGRLLQARDKRSVLLGF